MMALEARTLEKLDNITSRRTNLIIPKPSKVVAISSDLVALISNVEFS